MTSQFPEIPVIYEDEDLLVINKPPGIVVNRSQTQHELTIQDWIEQRDHWKSLISNSEFLKEYSESSQLTTDNQSIMYGDPIEIFKERSGVAHRLDKETSGVLLIAKNPEALASCMSQFKLRTTEKKYIALIHGKLQPQNGEINLPIARSSRMRMQFAVREDGKASVTTYHVLEYFPLLDTEKIMDFRNKESEKVNPLLHKATEGRGKSVTLQESEKEDFYTAHLSGLPKNFRKATKMYQGFTLVDVSPKTGRTHQIRVHLAHLRHPVVGDKMYSGDKKRLMDEVWCPRTFLHAKSLKITHPRTKGEIEFVGPLTKDLEKVLEFLID